MRNKRKLIADTAQKLGLGFTIAAFVQATAFVEQLLFAVLAISAFVIAFLFTDEGD